MATQQANIQISPYIHEQEGMNGHVMQVPLNQKQQKSQTVHNFIQYLADFYDGFEVQGNFL